jgi:hypothetical protein
MDIERPLAKIDGVYVEDVVMQWQKSRDPSVPQKILNHFAVFRDKFDTALYEGAFDYIILLAIEKYEKRPDCKLGRDFITHVTISLLCMIKDSKCKAAMKIPRHFVKIME